MTPRDTEGDEGAESKGGTSVVLNAISVLRSFTVQDPVLGVSDIASRIGLHKSTVSRILATLETQDLVERDESSRRFRLGLGVIAMAGPLLANLDVRRVAYPVLQDLARRTGETAALMLWDGAESVCVEQVPSHHLVKHTTSLGTRYADAASSSVQVFLAGLDTFTVRQLVLSGTISYPGVDEGALEAYLVRLAEVRDRGVAVNYGDTSIEEVGVAAPVLDHRGRPEAVVLLSAPRFRVSTEQVSLLIEAVSVAAAEVTNRLGGSVSAQD